MSKIVLINPPSPEGTEYVRVDRCMQKKSAWAGSLWQPMQLLYAQSMLKKNGYNTKLKDATAESLNYKDSLNFVIQENPDFLIVNTSIPTIHYDGKFASEIKKKLDNTKTIACGIPTILLPSIIAKYNFDYAILGDVEYAILDIVRKEVKTYKKIKNTTFLKHRVDDLEELPFPTLDDLNLDKYRTPFDKERLMLVEPGRGCPYNCIFCLVPPTTEGVRYRDPKNFVDELERDYKKYNIKNFLFWIETATLNRDLMISICDEIIKRDLKIKWMTPSRVDTIDQTLLNKMKEAGCWLISYGIESTNQRVLDLAKKGTTVEQIKKAIKMTHKSGINVMSHIIIGLPGDSKKSFKKTLKFLIDNNVDYCQFYCAVPYWKTKLRKMAEKNNWIKSNDPRKYEIDSAVMRNEKLSSKKIENLREYGYKKFYFRPSFIIREIIKHKFNPIYLFNLFEDGLYFLKTWIT